MNNVLDYGGYRFYQSAYDTDEMGTILSVNRDRWGTMVSYIGYFFLFAGILLSLINPSSRFRSLGRQLAESGPVKKALVFLVFTGLGMISPQMVSAGQNATGGTIPAAHARSFGELLVQDFQGRIKPVNTLSSEALRKVSRQNRLEGSSPEQVMLGMLTAPGYWQSIPMIRISHPEVQALLGREGNYASFTDFFSSDREEPYRILEKVQAAHSKKSSDRSKFDTEILRVDERVNICYMIYTGEILRILPARDDPAQTWHSPVTISGVYSGDDSLFAANITQLYLGAVGSGMETGDWSAADEYLGYIKVFQERMGGDIMPSAFRTRAEILYNKVNVFERLARFYLMIGITLLLIQLINILGSKPRMSWLKRVMVIHLLAGFGAHTLGLAVRWFVSGHAPWSNGYESLIYISWATMLAGAMFSRRNATPLAATAVLSWIILHTAHLSWMDPQMTNLVPVLKSYWLTIHVAVIASSYGFLGLAALMGFLNLILMALQSGRRVRVRFTIETLSSIAEMTIIAGLGLLTIGTFLGGIWANESWGRYWAWDAKESWALITILVYAFIAHMRFVPGLKSLYTFNLAALLGYASVLMTYFGVNYYLSGMHSYAAGDPVPVPNFVWYTLGVTLFVSLGAYRGEVKSRLNNNTGTA
jgi:cytochrome c-type biogenesis protein CcsB